MTGSRWNVCGVLRWGKDENFKNLFYIRRMFHASGIFQLSFCISVRGGSFQRKQDCISVFGIFPNKNRFAYSVLGIFQRKSDLRICPWEFSKENQVCISVCGLFPAKTSLHILSEKFSRENLICTFVLGSFLEKSCMHIRLWNFLHKSLLYRNIATKTGWYRTPVHGIFYRNT